MFVSKINLYLLLFLCLTCSISKKRYKAKDIKISGVIIDPQDKDFIFIYLNGVSKQQQTAKLKTDSSGYFETIIQLKEPQFFKIDFYGRQENTFIAYDEDIYMEIDWQNKAFEIKNSIENQRLADWYTLKNQLIAEEYHLLKVMNKPKISPHDTSEISELLDFYSKKQKLILDFANTMIEQKSMVSILAVRKLDIDDHLYTYQKVYSTLGEYYSNIEILKVLQEEITLGTNLALGQVAPNIQIPDNQNNTLILRDLLGKYVLIDFWASWCRPCRQANPELVVLYDEFKHSGFEIFGVSLDSNKKAWLQAIKKDGLQWLQGSELKGWYSDASKLYQVKSIPYSILLDKEGKIIIKNPSIRQIKNTLNSAFANL